MIKNITFNGITRTPSAKIVEQGECSESLNIQINKGEVVPMPEPQLVNEELNIPLVDEEYDVLYIHKGTGYSNTICKQGKKVGVWKHKEEEGEILDDYDFVSFLTLEDNEEVRCISSVGNTIIISTTSRLYYMLWEKANYTFLGNEIPMPKVRLVMFEEPNSDPTYIDKPWGTRVRQTVTPLTDEWGILTWGGSKKVNWEVFNNRYESDLPINESENPGEYQLLNNIQSNISAQADTNSHSGIYSYPVWAAFGMRLFDDTIRCTIPVLLGVFKGSSFQTISVFPYATSTGGTAGTMAIQWHNAYRVYLTIDEDTDLSKWKDIILSFDIYTSKLIGDESEGFKSAITEKKSSTPLPSQLPRYQLNLQSKRFSLKQLVFNNASTLYLKKRYDFLEFRELGVGNYYEIDSRDKIRGGQIGSLETLKDAEFANYDVSYGKFVSTNNRLIAFGSNSNLLLSNQGLTCVNHVLKNRGDYQQQAIVYYPLIGGEFGSDIFIFATDNTPLTYSGFQRIFKLNIEYYNNARLNKKRIKSVEEQIVHGGTVYFKDKEYYEIAYGTFYIPYSKIESIDIGSGFYSMKKIPMTEHMIWDGVYMLGDYTYQGKTYSSLELPLTRLLQEHGKEEDIDNVNDTDDIINNNTLYLSEVDSVFSFPKRNNFSMSAEIIDVGIASTALSQGQFGAFPIYVFTKDGIYAISLTNEGKFSSAHLVSRDVAYPGTVTPLDQALAFVSDKGAMLLSGSEVKCISSQLDGKTYTVDNSVKDILQNSKYEKLIDTIDDTSFDEFIKAATSIYDYVNDRIVYINKDKAYQYVYKRDSDSWHKMSMLFQSDTPLKFEKPLNSYPDAYAIAKYRNYPWVYNISTRLIKQDTDMDVTGGIVVSRPIDCDNPNGYDVIDRIRVRGIFKNDGSGNVRHPVKYLLLASNDGVNFTLLHSTRGGSWKYFRLVVLSDMQSMDRLSYITLETTQKFNNKVR